MGSKLMCSFQMLFMFMLPLLAFAQQPTPTPTPNNPNSKYSCFPCTRRIDSINQRVLAHPHDLFINI